MSYVDVDIDINIYDAGPGLEPRDFDGWPRPGIRSPPNLGERAGGRRLAAPGKLLEMIEVRRRTQLAVLAVTLALCRLCAAEEEICSKVLGFNESSGPKDRSYQDLSFCDEHHHRTCCEKNHTKQVRSLFAGFSHERSGRCAQMGRLAFCSICDGDVGTGMKAQDNLVPG